MTLLLFDCRSPPLHMIPRPCCKSGFPRSLAVKAEFVSCPSNHQHHVIAKELEEMLRVQFRRCHLSWAPIAKSGMMALQS